MLGYTDPVRITRAAPKTAAPNTGRPVASGPPAVVFDGLADVQDGAQTLQQMAGDAGERLDANAAVFFPPGAEAAFAAVRVGDAAETPLGSGTVVRVRHTDVALDVRVTRSTPAEPVIL